MLRDWRLELFQGLDGRENEPLPPSPAVPNVNNKQVEPRTTVGETGGTGDVVQSLRVNCFSLWAEIEGEFFFSFKKNNLLFGVWCILKCSQGEIKLCREQVGKWCWKKKHTAPHILLKWRSYKRFPQTPQTQRWKTFIFWKAALQNVHKVKLEQQIHPTGKHFSAVVFVVIQAMQIDSLSLHKVVHLINKD